MFSLPVFLYGKTTHPSEISPHSSELHIGKFTHLVGEMVFKTPCKRCDEIKWNYIQSKGW